MLLSSLKMLPLFHEEWRKAANPWTAISLTDYFAIAINWVIISSLSKNIHILYRSSATLLLLLEECGCTAFWKFSRHPRRKRGAKHSWNIQTMVGVFKEVYIYYIHRLYLLITLMLDQTLCPSLLCLVRCCSHFSLTFHCQMMSHYAMLWTEWKLIHKLTWKLFFKWCSCGTGHNW